MRGTGRRRAFVLACRVRSLRTVRGTQLDGQGVRALGSRLLQLWNGARQCRSHSMRANDLIYPWRYPARISILLLMKLLLLWRKSQPSLENKISSLWFLWTAPLVGPEGISRANGPFASP